MLELTGRKASTKILKIPYQCQEFAKVCLQNVFSGLFFPRGKTSLLQEQILSFRFQISFPFRADPIQEKFLSRKAYRKSKKLLYFIKMAGERGTVSSYLNVCGYTTVLYRLFCKTDSRIIYAGKGWGSTLSEGKRIGKIE